MSRAVLDAVARVTRSGVAGAQHVGGGDINEALRVHLDDGRELFVKYRDGAPAGMYEAEAGGLAWLAEAGAPVPAVVAVGALEGERFLALEWIEPGRRSREGEEGLGRDLAALHATGAPAFGLDHDNYLGTLEQDNERSSSWPDFYGQRRLLPLTRRALSRRSISTRVAAGMETLVARLPDLVGHEEPPSRLHGDLWSGNALAGADGVIRLIDPAVYGGHREVDLAMMRLFGGFGERTFAAYAEAAPLSEGHEDRVELYQLYPLLAHAVMFGGMYGARVENALSRYVDVPGP